MEEQTRRLLATVWGNREGFISLPYKEGGTWHEDKSVFFHINGSIPDVSSIVDRRADIYFCPVVFSQPHRRKEYALPTNILWADLDPVHPKQCRIRPSIAWESSPNRYQALWFLTEDVAPDTAAELSKRIAYADGADTGGWDLTQVLRIPGTRNYKPEYKNAPEVKLLWAKRKAYSPNEFRATYPEVSSVESTTLFDKWPEVPQPVINAAFEGLPKGYQQRIIRQADDRSLELQKLARDLLKLSLGADLVVHLLQMSANNKFRGRADEHKQLMKQVESAKDAVGAAKVPQAATEESELKEPIEQMKVHQWGSFLSVPTHLKWLVEDSWIDESVGFISGRSKSYKTWIALDLGLSVVSGAPFLDKFLVGRTGPVLLIQEEDPMSVLQERLRLIGKRKGMLPSAIVLRDPDRLRLRFPEYPFHIINLQGFSLGAEEKVNQVRQLIAELNPVLVILDPLIVMLGDVDENRGTAVSNILQKVKMWREEFGCSVAIVHHWNKTKSEDGDRGGQHMYGSFAFHAWLESALHVTPIVEDNTEKIDTVIVEREFKAAPSGRALKVRFNIDSAEKYTYEPLLEASTESPMAQKLLDLIAQTPGISLPELVAQTGHARPRVSENLAALVRHDKVDIAKGGGRGKSNRYWLKGDQPVETPSESTN